MIHLAVFAICLAGFAALATATDRQQRILFDRVLPPAATRMLRLAGAGFLLLVLCALAGWQGWGLGLVMLSGHTSLAAGIVYCVLIGLARRRASRPRRARHTQPAP